MYTNNNPSEILFPIRTIQKNGLSLKSFYNSLQKNPYRKVLTTRPEKLQKEEKLWA